MTSIVRTVQEEHPREHAVKLRSKLVPRQNVSSGAEIGMIVHAKGIEALRVDIRELFDASEQVPDGLFVSSVGQFAKRAREKMQCDVLQPLLLDVKAREEGAEIALGRNRFDAFEAAHRGDLNVDFANHDSGL